MNGYRCIQCNSLDTSCIGFQKDKAKGDQDDDDDGDRSKLIWNITSSYFDGVEDVENDVNRIIRDLNETMG